MKKRLLLAVLMCGLIPPTMAQEQTTPKPAPTSSSEKTTQDTKKEESGKAESTNIVDFCRTHTC
jgi:hypothetical protein